MTLTNMEQITTAQVLEFIKYMNTDAKSGSKMEAIKILELFKEVLLDKHNLTNAKSLLEMDVTACMVAELAIACDVSPALACWLMGFTMGVKFSNKELVDKSLEWLEEGKEGE